ncbi:hypothetical protein [Peribacillus simplex]|uniref:hypothetical protein n=1 Tax=Peribacillus simplex TaxID=1478 RepID=UPI0011DCC038|nr:hypothetical protein [Peribacillus simplex]
MPVKGFFEDWDGEIVLSDVRNFKDAKDFLEKAEEYVKETRGYRVPVLNPTIDEIVFNDEEWFPADTAENEGFEGEKITVFASDINWGKSEGK